MAIAESLFTSLSVEYGRCKSGGEGAVWQTRGASGGVAGSFGAILEESGHGDDLGQVAWLVLGALRDGGGLMFEVAFRASL